MHPRSQWNRDLPWSRGRWRYLATMLALLMMLGWGDSAHIGIARAAADYAENQVTVSLAPGEDIAAFNAAHSTSTAEALPDGQTYVLNLPAAITADAAVSQWTSDPGVATIEPDYGVALMTAEQFYLEFSQFYLDFHGAMLPSVAQGQWALSTIEAAAAQSLSASSAITVAVLDTGVDPTHPLLAPHLALGGYDYISQTATISDVAGGPASGHGTFVAGLIAQVAPQARILPFRVLANNGQGTASTVADAIETAVNDGARVINLSMGTTFPSVALHQAILFAQQHGVVVVASAGNDGASVPQYPAAWSGVLAVAGTDQNDRRASFSNYGPWISVSAPAVDLYSTYPNGFACGSGTSFAAALVSGEAALLQSQQPMLTATDVSNRIAQGSVDINDLNPTYEEMLGAGRIDALKAFTEEAAS